MIEPSCATRRLSACIVPMLAIIVAGCAGTAERTPDPNVYPSNYKTEVQVHIRSSPDDFIKVREAYISAPALQQFSDDNRYFVCLRTLTQDGRKDTLIIFFAGRMNQFVDATREQCDAAAYQPFPEFMQMIRSFPGNRS
jgi:hypothetical protein